jgi:hypothetical protein
VRQGNDNDKLRQLYVDSDDLVEQVASSFEFNNSRRIEFSTEFESYVVPIELFLDKIKFTEAEARSRTGCWFLFLLSSPSPRFFQPCMLTALS